MKGAAEQAPLAGKTVNVKLRQVFFVLQSIESASEELWRYARPTTH